MKKPLTKIIYIQTPKSKKHITSRNTPVDVGGRETPHRRYALSARSPHPSPGIKFKVERVYGATGNVCNNEEERGRRSTASFCAADRRRLTEGTCYTHLNTSNMVDINGYQYPVILNYIQNTSSALLYPEGKRGVKSDIRSIWWEYKIPKAETTMCGNGNNGIRKDGKFTKLGGRERAPGKIQWQPHLDTP